MGAVRNQNLPPEEQNFDEMGIHPRKGSIKDQRYTWIGCWLIGANFLNAFLPNSSDDNKDRGFERTFSFMRRGSSRKKKDKSHQHLLEDEVCYTFPLSIVTQFVCPPAPSALSALFPILLFFGFGMHL